MVKNQLGTKKIRRTPTQVIDSRKSRVKPQSLALDPTYANKPVRTVVFVEVHQMTAPQVQLMVQKINEVYKDARGGIHYVIPVREGKLGSDIMFEEEFLKVVNDTCTIEDGKIVLKDGAKEVAIIRESV